MIKNREGFAVELSNIEKVDWYDDGGCAITRAEPGWGTFGLTAAELKGFKPQVGDAIVVFTSNFSQVNGVIIEGTVIRYRTQAEVEAEHEQWKKNLRLESLERYIAHGDELKQRAAELPLPLRERMARFDREDGIEFWIESAGYEMHVMEGAAALLRKVQELGFISDVDYPAHEGNDTEGAIKWINDWWDINSAKHNYDYERQMSIVPDFGDGHSGNTAGAAKSFAVFLLKGEEV